MKINQFSQIGKRNNNEDSLGTSAALLTVCDGMGGHNYGERASAFVKEAMLKAFAEPKPLGKMEIQQQLNTVQTDLNQLLETEPELEKMGTTFTGVFRTPDVWFAAHIGDSRIYLFRPSEQKLWHTWDHSLVGELMRTKEITVEAGRFHPMSNRISKAIIAQKDGKPASASIVKIDELKAGDIFLLCSDGVVEGWGDLELVKLFSDDSLSFEQKCKKLAEQCNAKSKDNNTAIVAEIEEGDAFSYGNNDELEWTTFAEVEADYNQYVKDNEEVKDEEPQLVSQKPVTPETPKAQGENPKPNAPKTETPKPQSATTHRINPLPATTTNNSGVKPKGKLFALLAALLLVVVAGIILLMRIRKPEPPDLDTQAYKACKTVADYRAYLSEFGLDALHYADARAYIDRFEDDSIREAKVEQSEEEAQAAQTELERKEKTAYDACTTIGACDSYLRVYPKGKFVKEVKKKKAELEKLAWDEADKAKAEAEQKAKAEAEAKAKAEAEQKAKAEAEAEQNAASSVNHGTGGNDAGSKTDRFTEGQKEIINQAVYQKTVLENKKNNTTETDSVPKK